MAAPAIAGSRIRADHTHPDHKGEDKFGLTHPDTFWQSGLEHGAKIGLGSLDYELVNL